VKLPIVFKKAGGRDPEASIYYEVAANGIFQVRDTGTYRAVTRAPTDVPGLLPEKERVELLFPRLPALLLEEAFGFFREVYRCHGGESIVILFYRPDTREFRVDAPPQTLPGYRNWRGEWRASLRLDYDEAPRPPGFLRFGTIHSHADMAAYSSFTDCQDEQYHDGLHVVYGHVQTSYPSRSACFVAGGTRFPLKPEDVLEPLASLNRPARPEWLARVQRGEPKVYASSAGSGGYGVGGGGDWSAGSGSDHGNGSGAAS
jgi:hypothetical protein